MEKKTKICRVFQNAGPMVRCMRQRKRWTMADLAFKVGSSKAAIGRIETGARDMNVRELEDICEALGVTVLSFVEELERSRAINQAQR